MSMTACPAQGSGHSWNVDDGVSSSGSGTGCSPGQSQVLDVQAPAQALDVQAPQLRRQSHDDGVVSSGSGAGCSYDDGVTSSGSGTQDSTG